MACQIRKVDYYYTSVVDQPGEAYKLLSVLADAGVNLCAFHAIPIGPSHSQLTLFPDDDFKMESVAQKSGLVLDGPHPAILVQGDCELSSLVEIHQKLYRADVNVFAANGISDGVGSYGYIIYIKSDDFKRAAEILNV